MFLNVVQSALGLMEKVPTIKATVTLLPTLARGRAVSYGQYRPHIVMGPSEKRIADVDGRTLTEHYQGV